MYRSKILNKIRGNSMYALHRNDSDQKEENEEKISII